MHRQRETVFMTKIMRYDDVKPCPFCGSTVYLLDVSTRPSGIELWDVYCANHRCYLSGGTNNMYETRQLAIEAWHTRVEPPELAALREQVKVLRSVCLDIAMACESPADEEREFELYQRLLTVMYSGDL